MPYKIYLVVCFCFISLKCLGQNTFVPDNNFEQALIDLGYDSPPINHYVPTANINTITHLDLVGKNILNLTGIEDFTALTSLDCSDNMLSQLDIEQNTNLKELYCSNNLLSSLNLSNNSNLIRVWCYGNLLTNLDFEQNSNLISLRCENNALLSLNISNCPDLNVLVCSENQLTTLDISNNLKLNRLECGDNLIENLNINKHSNLSYLSCEQNKISNLSLINNNRLAVLICSENEIIELDLSNNYNLTNLDISNNKLCYLNLKNGNNSQMLFTDFSGNAQLNCVVVDNPNTSHATWIPFNFSNYVIKKEDCNNFVSVDRLENVLAPSYKLPTLNHGNYFTGENGTGTPLFPGDVINTSQTIYIYDNSFCFSNQSSFYVFITENDYYIPKYFTPNGDGYHDVWKVVDNTDLINNITIYDRYGKLLKFLASNSNGWDGTLNGKLMPTDTYWYVIVLKNREVLKGYFTLKY